MQWLEISTPLLPVLVLLTNVKDVLDDTLPTKLHSGVEDDPDDNEHCSNCDQEVIYRGAKHTQISFQISPPPLWCHPTSPAAPLLILLHHHQHH